MTLVHGHATEFRLFFRPTASTWCVYDKDHIKYTIYIIRNTPSVKVKYLVYHLRIRCLASRLTCSINLCAIMYKIQSQTGWCKRRIWIHLFYVQSFFKINFQFCTGDLYRPRNDPGLEMISNWTRNDPIPKFTSGSFRVQLDHFGAGDHFRAGDHFVSYIRDPRGLEQNNNAAWHFRVTVSNGSVYSGICLSVDKISSVCLCLVQFT